MSEKKKNRIKWIITLVVGLALIATVIGLAVKLDRRTTNERLGAEAYSIGVIDFEGDVDKTEKTSIYTRNALDIKGLTIELVDEAEITYELYFYNAKDKFLEVGESLSSIPEGAKTVKIVITPIDDEEVTLTEIDDYANQLVVRMEK